MTNREFLHNMSDDDFAETIVDDGMFVAAMLLGNYRLEDVITDKNKCIEIVKKWLNESVEVI